MRDFEPAKLKPT